MSGMGGRNGYHVVNAMDPYAMMLNQGGTPNFDPMAAVLANGGVPSALGRERGDHRGMAPPWMNSQLGPLGRFDPRAIKDPMQRLMSGLFETPPP